MSSGAEMPWWAKAAMWVQSVASAPARRAAIRRDEKLKKFKSQMRWTEGTYTVLLIIDRVIAESEANAREMCNAQATKERPVIKTPFGGPQLVPPYVADPKAALGKWEITEVPLSDDEQELAKKGELGPAFVEGIHPQIAG
jgi:hypothetical protein